MAAPEASRSRSRRSALLSVWKIPRFSRGRRTQIRSAPILSRQNKKARQILADLSGYLARPNQRHWWFGKNYIRNLYPRRSHK